MSPERGTKMMVNRNLARKANHPGPWSHHCGSPYHRVCRHHRNTALGERQIFHLPNSDRERSNLAA